MMKNNIKAGKDFLDTVLGRIIFSVHKRNGDLGNFFCFLFDFTKQVNFMYRILSFIYFRSLYGINPF